MKNIIKAPGILGTTTILFATGYFLQLYTTFTQLIISLGIAGLLILAELLYIYNWIIDKDMESEIEEQERKKKIEEIEKLINENRDYIINVEDRLHE